MNLRSQPINLPLNASKQLFGFLWYVNIVLLSFFLYLEKFALGPTRLISPFNASKLISAFKLHPVNFAFGSETLSYPGVGQNQSSKGVKKGSPSQYVKNWEEIVNQM